jgi:hypothetical protein
MLDFAMPVEKITSPEVIVVLAITMAILWGIILEVWKFVLYISLEKVDWWPTDDATLWLSQSPHRAVPESRVGANAHSTFRQRCP